MPARHFAGRASSRHGASEPPPFRSPAWAGDAVAAVDAVGERVRGPSLFISGAFLFVASAWLQAQERADPRSAGAVVTPAEVVRVPSSLYRPPASLGLGLSVRPEPAANGTLRRADALLVRKVAPGMPAAEFARATESCRPTAWTRATRTPRASPAWASASRCASAGGTRSETTRSSRYPIRRSADRERPARDEQGPRDRNAGAFASDGGRPPVRPPGSQRLRRGPSSPGRAPWPWCGCTRGGGRSSRSRSASARP